MTIVKERLRLYGVTDRGCLHGQTLYHAVEAALRGGMTMVQLREKELDEETFLAEAIRLHQLCQKYQVPLIINDNVRICLLSGAEGVHIGQDDMSLPEARKLLGKEKIIGATAHNVEEAIRAAEDGADYLGCGAAFGSSTKKNARPIDRTQYRSITGAVTIPVCAIGGITTENVRLLQGMGLSGIAVISGLFGEPDIEATAQKLYAMSTQL